MKILLDTNILIQRENNTVVPDNIAQLIRIIGELNYKICIHPLSIAEIKKDGNTSRREINLSKLSSYPVLDGYPNYLNDTEFVALLPKLTSTNDIIDNQLLYCVQQNIVSHLITEDQALLHKADVLGLNTIYGVNEALEIFSSYLPKSDINLASTFKIEHPYNVDINDPIFETLKESYPEFVNTWWKKVVESDRAIYLFKDSCSSKINAILIPKIEDEDIDCTPKILRDKFVKICLFKVSEQARGLKLGEHLLTLAIEYAKRNNVNKLYLTHFKEENDYLLYLIESYGFVLRGTNSRGEEIYTKEIVAPSNVLEILGNPVEINTKYYPSFCDGANINKFIVPIRPVYHEMLFPNYKHKEDTLGKQMELFTLSDRIKSHGYGIKKAYLSHTFVSSMKPGDLVLFYRSEDYMAITSVGIVEQIHTKITEPELIKKLTAKRTVYSSQDIEKLCEQDTHVILFRWCTHLNKEVRYADLLNEGIITGQIQRIQTLSDENYRKIIRGNIDERFIIH
jgi:GNAT superfamily N-acetyltransferase/predicted nucleic acid-binding protein